MVSGGSAASISISLAVASVAEEVTVEAEDVTSIAAQLAPVKSLLDAGSARTEITSNYVSEFTSPVTDFADIIQAAPGTVSYTTNGIGNGHAKIFFRGFVDDDYTMTWDGVPFNDSNDPSHHSWAYFPPRLSAMWTLIAAPAQPLMSAPPTSAAPFISSRPRSAMRHTSAWRRPMAPGTPTRFWATSTPAASGTGKAHFWLNADYQSSDGYQTNSSKQNVAVTAKFDYKFSDRTYLTVIGTTSSSTPSTTTIRPAASSSTTATTTFTTHNNR